MTTAQSEGTLAGLFDLEQAGPDTWVGGSDVIPLPQLFGGQLVAQSIVAAGRSAGAGKRVHSSHTAFLRPGVSHVPVRFSVESLRDGRRLSVHEVSAWQDERLVCRTIVSSATDDDGVRHERPAPAVVGPEDSVPLQVLAEDDGGLGEFWDGFTAIEVRVAPIDENDRVPHSAVAPRNIWMRASDRLPDDPLVHRAALAYASDLMLMATAVAPHGAVTGHERTMAADWWAVSLDHTLWFRGDLRSDEWLLFEHTTPMAHAGRALINAAVFDTSGDAVCQVSQEALVRPQR
ncbi:acyl-CoA thioesterase II [Mumia zhuanghuii]|uniref:Acyl-CoA thioesterase n=2 Tax=Mumia TaxID=1546255 RepID=A0ABW1QPP6_9ACTN|nr:MULTISPECIES: acyl-CoA thioesterase domain-containing protein [Mumia]KAA1425168.1 acyl-CoA thioesterase II [Mumia zhuanghuii]